MAGPVRAGARVTIDPDEPNDVLTDDRPLSAAIRTSNPTAQSALPTGSLKERVVASSTMTSTAVSSTAKAAIGNSSNVMSSIALLFGWKR